MWPGKWISHSPGTNGQVASVRLNMTDAVTRVHQDSQFSSHWRCVLFGSLCPAADQVAHYPNPAKVSLWHWHKHYTLHTTYTSVAKNSRGSWGCAHGRNAEKVITRHNNSTTASWQTRSVNVLFFKAALLLLLPWMGDDVCDDITKAGKGGWLPGSDRVWLTQDNLIPRGKDMKRAALRLDSISARNTGAEYRKENGEGHNYWHF